MAKISTYALDTDIRGGDKLIGTDGGAANATKNFTLDKVADFLNTTRIESTSLRYKYQDVALPQDERQPGTISFIPSAGPTVPFSSLNGMILSGMTEMNADVSSYYSNALDGSIVLISNTANPSNFGVYKWISAVENPEAGDDFYTVSLDVVTSFGSLEKNKDYFITMLTYDYEEFSDKNYVHIQDASSGTWVVTHNLNKYPSVSVVDSAGSTVVGYVFYDTLNQVTITFSAPFSGKAFFN